MLVKEGSMYEDEQLWGSMKEGKQEEHGSGQQEENWTDGG